jgi:hypothetical protein
MSKVGWRILTLVILAVVLIPLASSAPDGLEKVFERLGWEPSGEASAGSWLADYTVPGIHDAGVGPVLAGVVGILAVFLLASGLAALLTRKKNGSATRNADEEGREPHV